MVLVTIVAIAMAQAPSTRSPMAENSIAKFMYVLPEDFNEWACVDFGVDAGIPAVPWIMPCLLGVVLLRRAGDEHRVA